MHQVIKSQFIYAESRSTLEGTAYIIHMEPPFLIGQVLTYRDDISYLSAIGSLPFWFAPVPEYRVIIHIVGSMATERRLSVSQDIVAAIPETVQAMAEYYARERVNNHKNYHEKFKIKKTGE